MKQATILLDRVPTRSEGDNIAEAFALEHYRTDVFNWRIEDEIPKNVAKDIAEQLSAQRRRLDQNACFIIISL